MFRFFAERLGEGTWKVEGEELHHLTRVVRLKVGDSLEVCDGAGFWAEGKLVEVNRQQGMVSEEKVFQVPPPKYRSGVAVGALKGGGIDKILPTLCELGVDDIHVYCDHGMPKNRIRSLSSDLNGRWERLLMSAVKQCKRSYRPLVFLWESPERVLDYVVEHYDQQFLASPDAEHMLVDVAAQQVSTCVIVGHEGGFSVPAQQVFSKLEPVRLGAFVLRSKTAAIAAAVVLAQRGTKTVS